MAIWHRSGDRDSVTPIEQSVIDDLARPGADAAALIDAALADAATHTKVARNRADKVVIGFTLGADLDAVARDLAGFERAGDDRADLLAARQLDARAIHLGNQALAEQRQNGARTIAGVAGIFLATDPLKEP